MKWTLVICVLLTGLCNTACTAEKTALAPFSWDTVPVYIHFGKSSGPLTDDEVKFVARTSNFVCFEKGHGKGRFGSTEKGIAHDAKRLKALNGKIKVLFYWNGFLNYQLYDACKEFKKHPDWIFRDAQGKPLYKTRTLEQYNLLNAEFRQWWASIAAKAVKEWTMIWDNPAVDIVATSLLASIEGRIEISPLIANLRTTLGAVVEVLSRARAASKGIEWQARFLALFPPGVLVVISIMTPENGRMYAQNPVFLLPVLLGSGLSYWLSMRMVRNGLSIEASMGLQSGEVGMIQLDRMGKVL